MSTKILLGMSGGTDSSVAAMLLKEQGYDVTGITFRFWDHSDNSYLDEAKLIAQQLGIEHSICDARTVFKKKIVGYFIDEYLNGRTPFPCIKCNNELKWKLILQEADRLGCEKVAMGHYVQIEKQNGHYFVKQGIDPEKDQSFFLWGLTQQQLARIEFPLGGFLKSDVRKMASVRGFENVAIKKDSLGACFCQGDYRPFLKSQLNNPDACIYSGNFVDEHGIILGKHDGFPLYTVGQRRGLIYLNRKVFVKEIRPERNEIVLAPLQAMYKTEFKIHSLNIVAKIYFGEEYNLICRIRYRKQNTPCRIVILPNNEARVELAEPLESIAPGQSAVFYRDGRILGGGIIQ